MRNVYIVVIILSALVLGAIIYGFTVVGSPGKQQALKLDQQRITDFNNINYKMQTYYGTNDKLPDKLDDLTGSNLSLKDPKTKLDYSYFTLTDRSYKLCATFETDSKDADKSANYYYYDTKNEHKKGYDCITFEIPDYY
ncbi:MAG: hypothetical protein A3I07_00655 [Candidatus Doudnabacteria bacterium RIFCSPLOWO2_02_FULL_42_9]|uniref:Type II secretion system protein GspG C-terminal domain-containing protein n=1 Tax=Candidatus Doudnabacteria bacterium RIFCSPHIGHO2_01_FULL_41_86 TaxID=1817821 RepID=A0A1F5NA15_9BACT|nr:MAG: hypothetical protein A2717_02665 [Candidatus Doudnabacteria bacterium RIFCSPHIGHO2_01_FULL_41_86]OGE75494.1 MAG: hypothetical protein A3K07_00995 [Candidatus Doudnabacteria bacterium RIFCSPHIGHO2_01_43_10]OGE85451.1 MAG: hypothetical protein A3E28_02235 [Candidatus Doudnabacteria bacterium RIFCSPHIGHO2_12_FULL_42_22]OGE86989.1 MAG: hypothetical protein A3C49_03070 [Candidatus Doudnabacteria bacterium RIFCSPHIGHO2_02_FULL_42_25]OGE92588.1 MAG: hypothetical protein A2895_03225 [Candidatus